jgi:hypothetical protein
MVESFCSILRFAALIALPPPLLHLYFAGRKAYYALILYSFLGNGYFEGSSFQIFKFAYSLR